MTSSENSTESRGPNDRRVPFHSLSRYDLLLAFVPTVFLVSIIVGNVLSLGTQTALAGASLVGTIALADALFINPPRGTGRS